MLHGWHLAAALPHRAEVVDVLRHTEVRRRVALHPEPAFGVEEPVRGDLGIDDRAVAEGTRPVAGVGPALSQAPRRVQTVRQRVLVRPVVVFFGEVAARDAEEDPIRLREVVVDAAAPEVAVRLIGLGRAEVVVLRRQTGTRRLVRRRQELGVEPVHRVHDPVRRNDVVRERSPDDPARPVRIGTRRQRVVDPVLLRVREQQEIREVAPQVGLGRNRDGPALDVAGDEVGDERVVREEEQLVPSVDHLRNHHRTTQRERHVGRFARLERPSSRPGRRRGWVSESSWLH